MTSAPAPTLPSAPEPMSPVDQAWLAMDQPGNPMVVASILEFQRVKDPGKFGRAFAERLLRQRRFRQRVVETGAGRVWLDDDAIHFGYHVQVRRSDGPPGNRRLQAAIGAEMSRALDPALPLWRIYLFVHDGGRVTLLFRAHHAIADGVAMMRGLLQLTDGASASYDAAPAVDAAPHGPLGGVIHRLESVNALLESLTDTVAEDFRHPEVFRRQLADAREAFMAVSRVFLLPDDNPPPLRARLSGRRAVAWTSQFPFAALRAFAHAQDVTINDVFLTALSGAFGRYLRRGNDRLPEQQNLRVSVPVNLRAPDDNAPGNAFGLVLVDLPVGLEGPHARLDVIAERMAGLKRSPEARAVLGALAVAGHLPVAAEKRLINYVGGKAAAVVSNLPGPRHALALAGARLANMVFWPPQTGGIGIGVSFLSYAGHISVGVSADLAQIARPQLLIDDFRAELETMLGRASAVARAKPRRRLSSPSTPRSTPPGVHHAKT